MLCLYPGSWAPLHAGHLNIAQYVERVYNTCVLFELCKTTYDKGKLTKNAIDERVSQFHNLGRKVVVTDNSSFVRKSLNASFYLPSAGFSCLSNVHKFFVVGYDSISRIDDKKYYFDSEVEKNRCIQIIKDNGWKFLVFPRKGLLTENLSPEIAELCIFHREYQETDISSTQIREAKRISDKNNYNTVRCLGNVKIDGWLLYEGDICRKKTETSETVVVQLGEEFIVLHPTCVVCSLD